MQIKGNKFQKTLECNVIISRAKEQKTEIFRFMFELGEKYQEASHKMGEKIEMLDSNTDTKQEI